MAVKFAAILFASVLVSVLVYELAIRRVGVTRFLFGMKPLRRAERTVGVPAGRPAERAAGDALAWTAPGRIAEGPELATGPSSAA